LYSSHRKKWKQINQVTKKQNKNKTKMRSFQVKKQKTNKNKTRNRCVRENTCEIETIHIIPEQEKVVAKPWPNPHVADAEDNGANPGMHTGLITVGEFAGHAVPLPPAEEVVLEPVEDDADVAPATHWPLRPKKRPCALQLTMAAIC
jgi:hypothetical protein